MSNLLTRTRNVYNEYPRAFWTYNVIVFIDRLGGFMLYPFFALYLTQKFDIGMSTVGILFAIFSISGMIGSALGGAIADRMGRKVVIIDEAGPTVRHVYLNVPHTPNVKPSWRGESIGWYEGDTLVVDTIGQNTKTVVDRFGTPHTEKLHVVERWRVIDQGLTLRVDIEVDDPDTFYQPWRTYQLFRRTNGPLVEEICAENNTPLFDYGTPTDDTPDF